MPSSPPVAEDRSRLPPGRSRVPGGPAAGRHRVGVGPVRRRAVVRRPAAPAPGLHALYLAFSGLGDVVLPTVAALTGLTWLQTFGNRFTDAGVQQLVGLTNMRHLYLEEETLTAAAFAFVDRLPQLVRLGLQDVDLDDAELETLRARLPGVQVDR